MYIVELFIKWLNKNKRGTGANPEKYYQFNTTKNTAEEQADEALTCKHNFMPLDSTGEVLACTKCGYLIKKR